MIETDASLRHILTTCRTIAVVGISMDEDRPSHYVSKYMQQHGYRIVPVNPRYTQVLGEVCYPSLEAIPFQLDMVDVFRRTEDVLPIAQSAMAIQAQCLWQQIGVVNLEADALVKAAGKQSVMDRCLKVEHARLIGR